MILNLIGIIVGALGLVLGIAAIILHFTSVTSRAQRDIALIDREMKKILTNSEDTLSAAKDLLARSRDLSAAQNLRPELAFAITRQWDFFEKTFHSRFEKHSICRRIVTNHIPDNANVLLDSGSTVDLVSFELLNTNKVVNITSNNVFAAMHLIGDRTLQFRMLPGVFNDRFAATYSDAANAQIRDQAFNVIVMATTAYSFDAGIMVHTGDQDNLDFKAAALHNFERSPNTRLVIAVDGTKFLGDQSGHKGVLTQEAWATLREKHAARVVIVTSELRPEAGPIERAKVDQELARFREARIAVECCGQSDGCA